jgi:threonylcarbamoyladenosine tRNA methylthiotransferase MtaB
VNSCSVTAKADGECRQFLRRLLRINPDARVVVTGCYATHAPDQLRAISPRIEVYSNKEKDCLPACVGFEVDPAVFGLSRFSDRSRAFVKVQDGCHAPCKYCIIPQVRSTLWSKPVEQVVKEIEALAADGHGEIVLTGIRLGLFHGEETTTPGRRDDATPRKLIDLKGLCGRIVQLPGQFRIRLSSLEITEVSDDLVRLVTSTGKICRHFHVPLQSADDDVLKAMGRWYSFDFYAGRVAYIKSRAPDAGITADVLTGFPTETDGAFENTLRRIEELGLTGLHVFPYSPRPGTEAASFKLLPPEVLRERSRRLIELGERLKAAHRARHVGTFREVLVEPEGEGWTDNYIRVKTPDGAAPGRLIPVQI